MLVDCDVITPLPVYIGAPITVTSQFSWDHNSLINDLVKLLTPVIQDRREIYDQNILDIVVRLEHGSREALINENTLPNYSYS